MVDLDASYARHARRFDEARVGSTMERPYLQAAEALVPAPDDVLDLGCGSGDPIARRFVEGGYRVTGVDRVREMLEICASKFEEMTWHHGDMRGLDLGREFGIVLAWDSFFHLGPEDQRGMFSTFRQHTAPGGVLVFTSGTSEGEAIGGSLFGDVLYHASLDSEEYARLLRDNGFRVVLHRAEDPDCGGHTVWIAQRER